MGKYSERNLYANEWIVQRAPRDIWPLVWRWVLTVLTFLLVAGSAVLFWWLDKEGIFSFMPLGLIAVIIFGALFLTVLIKTICKVVIFVNTEYVLTNRRLICKKGVFHKKMKDIPLLEIQGVYIDVPFWGRIFNYGNIFIRTSKGNIRPFNVQNAEEFKTTILGQIDLFERERLADQSAWTADAMLRGSRGYNPYAAYMQPMQQGYPQQSAPQGYPQGYGSPYPNGKKKKRK
ncbi:MAG: PH domain-containing protein [Clostridia bacterium]|nr:PH domain-containing protein [Clostridia bacterium]